MTVHDQLAELQAADLKGLAESDSFFTDIPVIARDKGSVDDAVLVATAVITPKAGKAGACLLIESPVYVDEFKNVSGGPMRMNWKAIAMENRLYNKDTANGGTGKRALSIARRFALLIKNYRSGGLTMNFVLDGITRTNVLLHRAEDDFIEAEAWAIEFHGREGDFTEVAKVAPVIMSPSEGVAPQEITLTCATADAAIYWTQDAALTHPWSGNEDAELYVDGNPITVAAGVLRARAFKEGSIASDVTAGNFT